MKTKIYSKLLAAVLLATPLAWMSCTDTWDDHYNSQVESSNETLLANIASDPDLANFYKALKGIGAEDFLNSPQQLTVWAPVHFTSAQADSVIAVYQKDVASGLKYDDNKAVTQFLQNHVALYARSVSSLTNDTVSMLNDKYMHLVGTSNASGSLSNNPFNSALVCSNGILYKTDHIQTFFPNVREYLEQQSVMDSLVSMITSFDEYELNEAASVAGGVQDGKTIYLDSVVNLSNKLLDRYGYIQREDSVYTLVAPTSDVWKRLYDQYRTYYNYSVNTPNADSLANINTQRCIIQGRFFNTSQDWKYNRAPQDSLCNTQYSERQSHNPRQNVYYQPESGILSGLEKVECSNGYVYVDNKGVIDPQTTFFGRQDIEGMSPRYYEIPKNSSNEETMNVATGQYIIYSDSAMTQAKKTYSYAQVTAKTASAQTSLEYTLPSTFSNCYYNIYVVTAPDIQNALPCWFQVSTSTLNEKGNYTSAQYFTNPHAVTEGSCANSEVILKQSNNQRCYVSDPEQIDTILVQSAVKWNYAGAGLDDGVVKMTIGSFGPSSSSYREKIYTRTLRIVEIILIPYETEEEALAAQDDRDAFNDELLEANKNK